MARYIDADKLIAHLKDEIKECEIPFGSRANGKGVAYGTALGLKSAISFVETLSTADVVPKSELEISQHLLKDAWKRIEELDALCGELQRKYDLAVAEREANVKGFTEELEKANAEIERLKKYNTDVAFKHYNDGKAEVAGEILTDIKALMQFIALDYKEVGSFDNADIVGYVRDHLLAELTKRYVEGEQ